MALPEQLRPVVGSMRGKPPSSPFTYDEVQELEWDGHRYEIFDGVLVVNPSPRINQQRTVGNLNQLLRAATPPGLEVVRRARRARHAAAAARVTRAPWSSQDATLSSVRLADVCPEVKRLAGAG